MIRRKSTGTLSPAALAKNAIDVAIAFRVNLVFDDGQAPHDAGALHLRVGEKQLHLVACKPITDETSYAVALHELGHCIAPNGSLPTEHEQARTPERHLAIQMVEEEAAWEWAEHHALEWTDLMESVRQWSIGTYKAGTARHAAQTVTRARAAGRNAETIRRMLEKQRR